MESFDIPRGEMPLGGVFATGGQPLPSSSNAHHGPHSIQVAPDGSLWITLALGNELARFDPVSAAWAIHPLEEGLYPHTLRFDARGRIWFTVAASNHLGMLDPATGSIRTLRLPCRTAAHAPNPHRVPPGARLGTGARAAAASGHALARAARRSARHGGGRGQRLHA